MCSIQCVYIGPGCCCPPVRIRTQLDSPFSLYILRVPGVFSSLPSRLCSIVRTYLSLLLSLSLSLLYVYFSYCDAGTFQRAERPRRYYQRETRLDWEPLTSGIFSFYPSPFLFLIFPPPPFSPIQLTSQQEGSSSAQPPRPAKECIIYIYIYIYMCIHNYALDEYTHAALPTNRLLIYCWMTAAALWWSRAHSPYFYPQRYICRCVSTLRHADMISFNLIYVVNHFQSRRKGPFFFSCCPGTRFYLFDDICFPSVYGVFDFI